MNSSINTRSLFTAALLTGLLAFLATSLESQAQRGGGRSFDASREGARGGSVDAQGQSYGRYRSGSVSAEGPNGGTYDASGTQVGRFGKGSVSAQGANGGTYDASATKAGRYSQGSVNAQGVNGGTYQANAAGFNGYRSGYVYTGGVYRPASVTVNTLYVAPVGIYAGWNVLTQPYYVTYPFYATYPVETAVQVELTRRNYYRGTIDGQVGPGTQDAIRRYQNDNSLKVTGNINQALLVSLGIVKA